MNCSFLCICHIMGIVWEKLVWSTRFHAVNPPSEKSCLCPWLYNYCYIFSQFSKYSFKTDPRLQNSVSSFWQGSVYSYRCKKETSVGWCSPPVWETKWKEIYPSYICFGTCSEYEGGPLREFFHLLMYEIAKKEMLFTGPDDRRVPRHCITELQKKPTLFWGR